MTQAVSGVHRVWLVFSGLAFLVCGLLLVARFSRSSAPAATMPSPAKGSVIHQQLSVPANAAPAAEAAASPTEADKVAPTPDPVEPPKASPHAGKKKIDKPRDSHGRPTPRSPGSPTAIAGASKPTSRGLELNDPMGGELSPPPSKAPEPGSIGRGGEGVPPPPVAGKSRALSLKDIKPEHVKPKAHKAPPAVKEAPHKDVLPTPPTTGGQADKLVEGVLKVNAPTSMLVGESEHIRAVVGTKAHGEAVANEAMADVGEGPRVQLGRDMLLSPLVRMELRADVPGDFDITAFVPQAEQRLTDNETTVWDWAVQPKHEGLRGLTLIVTDLKETSHEPIRTKTYPVHIEVRVATITKVHDLAVSISSVLSGLAGLIGAWMGLLRPVLQRRREGEAGMGMQRPAMSGAPPRPPGPTGNTLRPEADPPSAGSPPRQ